MTGLLAIAVEKPLVLGKTGQPRVSDQKPTEIPNTVHDVLTARARPSKYCQRILRFLAAAKASKA